jgi:hypothetical protein
MGKSSVSKLIIPIREMPGRNDTHYYIGNCELDINLKDTILFIFFEGDEPKIVIEPKSKRENKTVDDL